MRVHERHHNWYGAADQRRARDDYIDAYSVHDEAHQDACDDARDGAWDEPQGCLERGLVLHFLIEEVGNLLEGVEGAPDHEYVYADVCEDAVAPEAVGN